MRAVFERFVALVEDEGTLERIGAGSLAIYRIKDGRLHGLICYGAFPAVTAIDAYCRGFEDGILKGRTQTTAVPT